VTTWVALLRAVNLGARNKVPMAELRTLLERDGLADVRTYIQSGNVVFDSAGRRSAIARRLEETIAAGFGVTTTAILRTADELAGIVAAHPFGTDTSQTYVSFLASAPAAKAVERLAALDHGSERVVVAGTEAYLNYPQGYGRAQLSGARLEKLLGVPGTVRNWRTVEKIGELCSTT
jgi:uncharacterized protein (DUF1697 family)